MGLNGFIFKKINLNIKTKKKSWEPFGSYLLNSTANPAQFGWKWAGLAVLFGRRLPNGSHVFFIFLKNHLNKNPQTTNALTFLAHIILAIGGVAR